MQRLFVAIDLPERVREGITDTYAAIPGARWVEQDQLHMTLRFIGDTDAAGLDDSIRALGEIRAAPFTLSLTSTGHFPPRRNPTVLWIGVAPSEPLLRLRNAVEGKLRRIGHSPDTRKFHPHITVARLRERAPLPKVVDYLRRNSLFKYENIEIGEFHLYSSVLTRERAVHRCEATFALEENGV